jgi:hypothetical protein
MARKKAPKKPRTTVKLLKSWLTSIGGPTAMFSGDAMANLASTHTIVEKNLRSAVKWWEKKHAPKAPKAKVAPSAASEQTYTPPRAMSAPADTNVSVNADDHSTRSNGSNPYYYPSNSPGNLLYREGVF